MNPTLSPNVENNDTPMHRKKSEDLDILLTF